MNTRQVKYAVGVQENGIVMGLTSGPFSSEQEALDVYGDYHGVIVRFNKDGTEEVTHRWATHDDMWEHV